jgi:D-glycero-D-manno-heptose 1,7-bisphosphate phosphatase
VSDPSPLERYRLCIFDADGTLRRTIVAGQPCPRASNEWVLMPGVRDALLPIRWGDAEGPRLGIASNQDQIGLGLLDGTVALHLLRDLLRAATGVVPPDGAIAFCPHRADAECECRKPRPGLLRSVMRFYGIGPDQTVFVGDHETDRLAAAAAGTAFIDAKRLFGCAQTA